MHADQTPRRIAVRDSFQSLTYAQLIELSDRVAEVLSSYGLRAGQRVLMWMPTRIESILVLLACSRNGYIWCPSPHRSHATAEVADLIQRTRAAAFFFEPGFGADADIESIETKLTGQPWLRCVHRIEPASPRPVSERIGDIARGPLRIDDRSPASDPDAVSYLAFTSGSTGKPKGVMHSDNTLLSAPRAIASDWSIGPDTVVYSMSPLSHNLGVGTLLTSLIAGSEFIVHDLSRGQSVLKRLIETKTSYLVGVPTHAIDLLAELKAYGSNPLNSLKGFRISGAAVPNPVVAELLTLGVLPQKGYGMTETCAHQYTMPTDDSATIIETSGRSFLGYALRVWNADDPDRPANPGEIGVIGGKGASLMLGYYDDQTSSETSFNADG